MSWFKRGPNPLEIAASDAHALVNEGKAVIVDVREPYEWRSGHAVPATHIPLGGLATKIKHLPKDREILLICESGSRSLAGARWLADAGFPARSIMGGTPAWSRAGLPIGR